MNTMKVWTDKDGNKLTLKEFKNRWKEGMMKVSMIQQLKVQLIGYSPIFFGIIWGMIISFRLKQYWLFSILIGSLIISFFQFYSTMQKYLALRKFEKEFENETAKAI